LIAAVESDVLKAVGRINPERRSILPANSVSNYRPPGNSCRSVKQTLTKPRRHRRRFEASVLERRSS
jgi:hypothetical protein